MSALAIRAPAKWLDNLISQHEMSDVTRARRGVARRISHPALLRLTLARELHVELGLAVRDALAMATSLLDARAGGVHRRGHLSVACDRIALERDLEARLRDALESTPTRPRGRPPRRASGHVP